MRRFAANRDILLDMISRPDFYETCPEFVDLQEAALAAYADYASGKKCCGGPVHKMFPVLDAAMARLKQLQAEGNQVALDKVKQFLSTKRGTKYDTVAIYYRKVSAGLPDRIVF